MRKNFKTIFAFLVALALVTTGCADFTDTPGKSVWSEGLWILPWLTGLGSLWFFSVAYRGSKSGSKIIEKGAITDKEGGNVPIYQFGQFYFGIGLLVATVFIIWNVLSNR